MAWGDVPYTLQPGECKQEGDYIHLTPDYLTKDPETDVTHRPGIFSFFLIHIVLYFRPLTLVLSSHHQWFWTYTKL